VSADASPSAPGWFGKVVMLGDFAHRRLPQPFIAACDAWLSQSIATSRAQLGARWLDTYLTGPVWRFAWAPGVVGPQWWFGVMMPSVDAVGRYYPLVVAATVQNPPMSEASLTLLSRWYDHAGRAALATLQPGASVDTFDAALTSTPSWPAATPHRWPESAGALQRWLLPGRPTLSQWAQALAAAPFDRAYAGHSLWCPFPADDDPNASASLTAVPGLPPPDQYALMLEGRW
jgi:type VI secretion system protein ImpM